MVAKATTAYATKGRTCAGSLSLRQSQSLNDGESLSFEGETFELGFFSPGSRRISSWAFVLDSGNLIVRDEKGSNSDVYLWQSFDYPSDTLLSGMKFGWDLRSGLNRRISLWRNSDDPSPGELSNGIELHEYPQAVIWKGSRKYFRGGPWTGDKFSGAPELRVNPVFDYSFISNKDEVYYTYRLKNKSVISRLVLNETSSSRQRYMWVGADQAWRLYALVPRDYCDSYSLCGANGDCVISDSPVCQCLEGFRPKSSERWTLMDWSQGCILSKPLSCQSKDVFRKFSSDYSQIFSST
ncbi:hypothetical protein T459_04337 [Capsicum annuum]|uniref:EGF-like domain-containing protein n=2 Tax=Capsicum annuum TaxID=4072 RepID=A0A2G3A4S5_CAPAN|nr:hypothetical protein T459_04337 [Capsicum annuum]